MCSNTIVPAPAGSTISIRQYGLPYNETLSECAAQEHRVETQLHRRPGPLPPTVTYTTDSATIWPSVLSVALPQIFEYFEGQNDEALQFIQDRAGPAATRIQTANNSKCEL